MQLIEGIKAILENKKDRIENYTVYLSDINKNAFFVPVEFFTAPIPVADFNSVRQEVNLEIIQLMNDMQVRLASKEGATPPVA
jgi:MscS family membrane protein